MFPENTCGSVATVFRATVKAWPDPEIGHHNWFVWYESTVAPRNKSNSDNAINDDVRRPP